MKKLFSFLLALSMSLPLMAERVDRRIALEIAKAFMQESEFVDLSRSTDYSNLYVFSTDDSFVIVSADDRVMPILAYSDEYPFVVEDMPDNVSYWMSSLEAKIQYAIDNDIAASKETASEWDSLKRGVKPEDKNRKTVAPLVRTQWNQNVPYMNMCPGGSVAGCVAVAMAQVMKYWECPRQGEGSHSYEENDYGTITVNFANTIYDWDNMIASPDASSTQAQQNAVATLMYHCGVSVDMNYSPQGSGAYPSDIEYALETYFGYDTELHEANKEDYTDTQWINLLKTELNAARPVLYSGWDVNNAGHCFVCDGYDENNNFHFNWGWGGYCDGYYAIGMLNPGTGGIGSGSGVYNEYNYILVGVEPESPSVNAPSNVVADVEKHDVTISWSSVNDAHHYKVYRNGFVINNNVTSTSITDTDLSYGLYKYQVRSVKSDGEYSLLSEPAEAVVSYEGPVPTDVTAVQQDGNNVRLTWDAPETESATLKYGDGETAGYPFGGNYNFYWGQRFTSEQLSEYAGMAMTIFQTYLSRSGAYTLYVYKEMDGALIQQVSQSFNYEGNASWKTIALTTPLVIDYSNDLVVLLYNNTIDYPAPYMNYNGGPNACLYSTDGKTFNNLNGTSWLFRTILSDGVYSYNVYRDGDEIASDLLQKEYTDMNLGLGTYEYTIRTNYHEGLSDPSEPVSITIADELVLAVDDIQEPSCNGSSDGQITVIANGGTPPYTYVMGNHSSEALNGSYTFEGVAAGTYTIEVTDSNGIQAATSAEVGEPDALMAGEIASYGEEIFENENPSMIASVQDATSEQGGITYRWKNNGDVISDSNVAQYTPSSLTEGTYKFTREVKDDCTDWTLSGGEWVVIVNKPDAIGENVDNEIKIYPNPTNGIVHVVCDNMKNITIMSLTGQVLVYEDVNDDDAVVDMSDLPQGVYIFRICKDDGSLIRKNVINNK